jgi:predicted dehydrogenase
MMADKNKKAGKLGVALVGLGSYATGQLAPALQETENSYLAGIVTGTPSKAATWKEKYGIPDKNIYNYDNYDSIKDNPDIDIIYVVLPNSMHAEYSIRAAKAGKHVICEKPMAITVEDCDKMINACKKAGKMLSIGYRLHFDPYHLDMVKMGTQKMYGEIKKIKAGFSFTAQKGIWRLDKKLAGGGPLMDLGIYCLQGVCYTTGMEPVAVAAQSPPVLDKEKFIDVEETLSFQMEMPNGLIAECRTSYSESANLLRAEAENGWFELQPSFNYSGLKGNTSDGKVIEYPKLSQQAKQLDGIAQSIKNNKPSIVPGEMGRRDMKIITAIYEAMRTGNRVEVK